MPEKSKEYYAAAEKMAKHVYDRGIFFPTETLIQDEAEPFIEEGSMSCSALTLLYFCAKVERKEEYIARAKEILDMHDNWVVKTDKAPMFFSSLRWWETKWEGDKDGNALCMGHAWTIWRAEADFWYFSTDTAAVLRAAEIGADAILLAKNIDGVYSADPHIDASAVKYDAITYDEVLAKHLAVMDLTATSLAMENDIPVVVFALADPQNIVRAVMGEAVGTVVTK